MAFRLQITALDGTPIQSIGVGEHFLLRAYAQDVRSSPGGVFSAYMDVGYDRNLVTSANIPIKWGSSYSHFLSGAFGRDESSAILDEIGATTNLFTPFGGVELLVFSVEFVAAEAGEASFTAQPADLLPAHNVLVHGSNDAVDAPRVSYGTTSIWVQTAAEDAVDLNLTIVDINGNRISELHVGEEFELIGTARDLRASPLGPRAVYTDVRYESEFAQTVGTIQHSPQFSERVTGSTSTNGLIDEVGGTTTNPLGRAAVEVFRQRMRATAPGTFVAETLLADESLSHGLLAFGRSEIIEARLHQISIPIYPLPVANPDQFTIAQHSGPNDFHLNVLENDVHAYQLQSVNQPRLGGTVYILPTGKGVWYSPMGFAGTDTFDYAVNDGHGGVSWATVTLIVRAPPISIPPNYESGIPREGSIDVVIADSAVLWNHLVTIDEDLYLWQFHDRNLNVRLRTAGNSTSGRALVPPVEPFVARPMVLGSPVTSPSPSPVSPTLEAPFAVVTGAKSPVDPVSGLKPASTLPLSEIDSILRTELWDRL